MPNSTDDWDEFIKARNELESANEYHLALLDKYTSVSTPTSGSHPLSVATSLAKVEIKKAKDRFNAAWERMRRAQDRLIFGNADQDSAS